MEIGQLIARVQVLANDAGVAYNDQDEKAALDVLQEIQGIIQVHVEGQDNGHTDQTTETKEEDEDMKVLASDPEKIEDPAQTEAEKTAKVATEEKEAEGPHPQEPSPDQ